jgi:PAS domain S-box-containing protein
MNQIDRAMQSASDVDGVLGNVLDVVLEVFACDRAFLGYPCDPQASTWQVAVERSRPAYPCVVSHRGAMPMDGEMAARLQLLLQASAPLQFGPGTEHPLPAEILDEFGFQSLMSVAVYPRGDKPWEFGIEQCAQSRVWSPDDEALLHEIGRRLADGLTSLLAHRRVVESEAHLRALVRTIPDLIWLKDPDGIFLRCNQQFERFVGLEEARIVGRSDLDIREREAALFYRENDRRILASGQSAVTEEWLTFASDGYRGLFEVIRTPLYDPAGNTLGILGVAHDITRRKRMEDALRASEREFRSLAENLPDVVMRYDLDCRRIYVNPAYLREIDGRLDQVINAELDAQQWHSTNVSLDEYKQSLQQAMRSGKSSELLVHWQSHLTGEALCYSLHIVPERDHHGQVSGVLCIGRNIASLLETERRLEASRLQLRGLAARREDAREEERRHIARELHDGLGQQLTALRFSVTMLDYQFGEEQPSIREVVGKLLQQVNRTIQTTREVSSAMRPPVLDMGIVPALEWLVAEYALLGSVSFELKGESGPVHMKEANTVVVFRIVQESLTNAVRHSKADRIQVIFGQEADVYVVEVRDNGIGFDPDGPHDPHSVGLVGIRERIHAVGGELVVSSAPGWGTVVRVRIPAEENLGEES